MARARKRKSVRRRRAVAAPVRRRRQLHRRRSNPGLVAGLRRRVFGRRRRRANPGSYRRRRHVGRRNPGMLTGTAMSVVGVVGGAAVTKLIADRLPSQLQTGVLGYLSTGLTAVILGWGVGKFAKKPALGNMMMIGGLTYVGLRILQDFLPGVMSISPFALSGGRGMGLIGPSSFYTPQVNQPGNMGAFVVPSSVMGALPSPAAMSGLGRRGARQGRM